MPRACSICSHRERPAIDEKLLIGQSARSIAAQYALSKDGILRHLRNHLGAALAAEPEIVESLGAKLSRLMDEAEDLLRTARRSKDLKGAIAALDCLTKQIALAVRAVEAQGSNTAASRAQYETLSDTELLDRLHAALPALEPAERGRITGALAFLGLPTPREN